MLDYIWKILKPFKPEFKKVRAFNWFVIIVVGFLHSACGVVGGTAVGGNEFLPVRFLFILDSEKL